MSVCALLAGLVDLSRPRAKSMQRCKMILKVWKDLQQQAFSGLRYKAQFELSKPPASQSLQNKQPPGSKQAAAVQFESGCSQVSGYVMIALICISGSHHKPTHPSTHL